MVLNDYFQEHVLFLKLGAVAEKKNYYAIENIMNEENNKIIDKSCIQNE